jgi:uncharacterized protein (TIGR03437 family)
VTAGANGPSNLTFFAYNDGDGQLNVEADGGFYSWLGAQVGAPAPCGNRPGKTCTPITLVLNTAALPAGTVTGVVQVRAPGALDAPQTLPVTVHVGGNVPENINFYVSPHDGSGDSLDFQTPRGNAPNLTSAGSFLRVSSSNLGSFRVLHEHRVQAFYQPGMPTGPANGSVTVAGSSFAADNRVVPVTLTVTSQPISVLSSPVMTIPATQGHTPGQQFLVASNRGDGALAVSGVEAATDSGGDWLAVQNAGNNIIAVQANIDGLEPGRYRGTIRVDSNAANSPQQVEVFLALEPERPPTPAFHGIISNATTDVDNPRRLILSPGSIAALFGQQLSFGLEQASAIPLPTELGGTRVVWTNLDGGGAVESPLYFVSAGQVNLQVPYQVTPGQKKLQVFRDGQAGNEITVEVQSRSSTLPAIGIARYGIVINATRSTGGTVSLPLPRGTNLGPGFVAEPARPSDILTIFATGLGPISPSVPSGALPTGLTMATDVPIINFGRLVFGPLADPSFVGLSPQFVGLYQVNVEVPVDAATNNNTWVTLEYPDGRRSNTVEIAVER